MKQELIETFMKTAENFAALSKAVRLHVGAIIVKDGRIISIGYNGTPPGWDNNCEIKTYEYGPEFGVPYVRKGFSKNPATMDYPYKEQVDKSKDTYYLYNLKTKPEVIHAEMNAIAKLARSNESGEGSTMFITHAPCMECAKLVGVSGITKVYYRNSYRDTSGIDFLEKMGVEVEQV